MKKLKAVLDLDWVKYTAASVGEKRTILVTQTATGKTREFSNRTEFYGRGKKKDGGWLGDLNAKRDSPYTIDEFTIQDIQTAEPVANCLHTAKLMVEQALATIGTKSYKGFIGKGDSFRLEKSTILKYKGNRDNTLRPLHMEAVEEYLVNKFKAEIIRGIEADDAVVIEAYGRDNYIVVAEDKDAVAQPVRVFNPSKPENGIIDCNCFGELYIDPKDDVRGYGLIWLAYQIASGDSIDNFKANSATEVAWGPKRAYKALQELTDPMQIKDKLKEIYQHLYPEQKVITGWRGDEILIDWEYVLNENFTMARMLTKLDDNTTFNTWLEI